MVKQLYMDKPVTKEQVSNLTSTCVSYQHMISNLKYFLK